ncbi:MAG: hypothetical protein IPI17_03465 [Nitrosomonas sp.]|jgi:hypothetical protein|nr:hypothetical protein [Nitrosomonas sp.]
MSGELFKDESGFRAQQDKDSFLDYSLDWSDWLAEGDSIASSIWSADVGPVLSSATIFGSLTTTWVQGGVAGMWYAITNTVTSAQGRTDQRTIRLFITDEAADSTAGTALFPNISATLEEMRRDQLALASKYALSISFNPSTTYLLSKLKAAEADASRQLRIHFAPTVIIPDDSPQSEIDALEAANTRYAQEAAYDYDSHFFSGEQWGYIVTKQKPIISVQSIKFAYPAPTTQVFEIPHSWIRLDKKYGHIRLVPAAQSFSAPLSAFIMQALGGGRTVPFMIHVRYTAGLSDPVKDYPDLVDLVKKMAVMRILQDAFLPQSGSISSDGLSQSLSVDLQKWHDGIEDKLDALRDAIHGPRVAFLGHA